MKRRPAVVIDQRRNLARICRDGRRALGWSQAALSARAGISRSYVAAIERAGANPTLDTVVRLLTVLGFEIDLAARGAIVVGDRRQRDAVHAWCSGYIDRRLVAAGWETAREVELVEGRWRGWIDLLAFDRRTGTLLVIEVKTRIDDMGAIERQVGWYARAAWRLARARGWEVRRVEAWLLVLASEENDSAIHANRDVIAHAFPRRAADLTSIVDRAPQPPQPPRVIGYGVAAVDPARRRRAWILPTRLDGRRGSARYRDYRDAAERRAGPGRVLHGDRPVMNARTPPLDSRKPGSPPEGSSRDRFPR